MNNMWTLVHDTVSVMFINYDQCTILMKDVGKKGN